MFDSAHFIARCLRYRLHTESLQLRTLLSLNLSGATVIDIGANKGIYSFWMSRAVGAAGRVLAFEPQPEMVRYIEAKRTIFQLGNVTLYNVALSDSSGTAGLLRQRIGDGSASLQSDRSRDDSHEIQVVVTSLDDIADIPNVSFIKCDVEGHEIKVFEGAKKLLERDRPVVQFEATADETPALFDLFDRLGYSGVMFLDREYRPLSDLERVPHRKFGLGGHRDFLFFPSRAIGSIIPVALAAKLPR